MNGEMDNDKHIKAETNPFAYLMAVVKYRPLFDGVALSAYILHFEPLENRETIPSLTPLQGL